ncbi:MAG: fumarylacetoacetate hydrolase family protein [Alloprevotella sp.]|nr:fumarylacetoacetate hydrolase family protein [Alloprevotella sp.]
MKTFILEGNYPSYNIPALFPFDKNGDEANPALPCAMVCVPDTTHTLRGKPFFIPDGIEECRVQLHVAVRISRLGRHIAARFAGRYYDALTLCATFTDAALLRRLREAGLPWELSKGFDGSVCVGSFVGPEALHATGEGGTFRLNINGGEVQCGNVADMLCDVEHVIAAVSSCYKLCDGDLILCGTPSEGVPVQINSRVEATLGGEKLLQFNVK